MQDKPAPLLIQHEPPLGWLVLNRPEVQNAIDLRTWNLIVEGMAELEADSEVRAIVMRSSTPEAFSSGADIAEFSKIDAGAEQARNYREAITRTSIALIDSPKPVIAMVPGLCIGAGLHVALCCDIRIAARSARFGVTVARLGLGYNLDGVRMLVQTVGHANARDIVFSARMVGGDEAKAMGLVNKVVEDAELESATRDYALRIGANAPLVIHAAKAAIQDRLKEPQERDAKALQQMLARCSHSEDYREGIRAFKEKRRPRFSGR